MTSLIIAGVAIAGKKLHEKHKEKKEARELAQRQADLRWENDVRRSMREAERQTLRRLNDAYADGSPAYDADAPPSYHPPAYEDVVAKKEPITQRFTPVVRRRVGERPERRDCCGSYGAQKRKSCGCCGGKRSYASCHNHGSGR